MQPPSPAKLYATVAGALLLVGGIVGFFYSASFGSPGEVDDALGAFAVNGWLNVVYIALGALGLLVAGFAPRRYAFWLGLLFVGAAIWGFVLGTGEAILGAFPVNGGTSFLQLALGLLGVGAALGTEKSIVAKKPRAKKPREKALNAPTKA